MDAKEARYVYLKATQMPEIYTKIAKAATEGKTKIWLGKPRPEIKDILEDEGYTLEPEYEDDGPEMRVRGYCCVWYHES